MSRRRILDDEEAEQCYREYMLWQSLAPKRLMAKYGITRGTLRWYGRRLHKTRKAA